MNITLKTSGFEEAAKLLDPKRFVQAHTRALNKLMDRVKVAATDQVVKKWNIKKSDLSTTTTGKARISIKRATWTTQQVTLFISGRPLSLSLFNARQIIGSRLMQRAKGGGLKAGKVGHRMRTAGPLPNGVIEEIHRGSNVYLRRAFMAQMKNGHVGIFHRSGKKIVERNVITVPSMFDKPEVQQEIERVIEQKWEPIFRHEIKYLIG
jgi:hypothetical protein